MGDTMHSRSNTRSRSNQVVRGIVASLLLSIGLSHSVTARAIEPRAIPLESAPLQEKPEERCADQVIEGGVAATMLFATLGLGAGVVAAAIDAESERKRDEPCRSCPGGFNDVQQDMAMVANVSVVSFVAAGIIGAATIVYAATVEIEPKKTTKSKAAVQIRAARGGVVITF